MIVAKSSGFGCCTFADNSEIVLAELRVPLRLRRVRQVSPDDRGSGSVNRGIQLIMHEGETEPLRCFDIECGNLSVRKASGVDQRYYRLLDGRQLLCSATLPARGILEISTAETQYLLYELSNWVSLRFQVSRERKQAGAIYEKGFSLSRRLFVDLDNSIPLAIQCFMVFLVAGHS